VSFKMLCSYAYFRRAELAAFIGELAALADGGPAPMVFADSGAHTARTKGLALSLDGYAQWCERWDPQLQVYANLDVIRAPAATRANQDALQSRGLTPLPVFHTGEPWSYLERYLEDGHTYIALGALLGHPLRDVMPWLAKAFRIAHGRAVFHGFGMTVWEALTEFPFYSVDSSSWSAGFRYGVVKLFSGGRWSQVRLRDSASIMRRRELIRAHGVDPMALATRESFDRDVVAGLAAVAYRRAEVHLQRMHGLIAVPDSPHNPLARRSGLQGPGLHLYLADTEKINFRCAVRGSRAIERGTACPTT
jgi:hypothetical protein